MSTEGNEKTVEELGNLDAPTGLPQFPHFAIWVILPMRISEEKISTKYWFRCRCLARDRGAQNHPDFLVMSDHCLPTVGEPFHLTQKAMQLLPVLSKCGVLPLQIRPGTRLLYFTRPTLGPGCPCCPGVPFLPGRPCKDTDRTEHSPIIILNSTQAPH